MRKIASILAVVGLGLMLSACATLQAGLGKVGDFVCSHQVEVSAAANQAFNQANQIDDPAKRAVAISAAEAMLNAVAACPVNQPTG